jgi:hypothetical protein
MSLLQSLSPACDTFGRNEMASVRFRCLADETEDPWVRAILLEIASEHEALAKEANGAT